MRTNKKNSIPDYKNPPPPPMPKDSEPKSAEQTAEDILEALKNHEPEAQNVIVSVLLREVAIVRKAEYDALEKQLIRSQANFKEFMDLQFTAERTLSAVTEKGR